MTERVTVPQVVLDQLLRVRATGRTNMFDRPMVQVITYELECHELVVWIEYHKREYGHLIMGNFTIEGEEENDPA